MQKELSTLIQSKIKQLTTSIGLTIIALSLLLTQCQAAVPVYTKFKNISTLSLNYKGYLKTVMTNTWNNYRDNFMENKVKVVDYGVPGGVITSEGQSYALLRAVWANDKIGFDNIYNWTKTNMQIRSTDKMFAWRINATTGVVDMMNATDAEMDISLALITASKKWGNIGTINYQNEVQQILDSVYTERVVTTTDNYTILLPFNTHLWRNKEILNPSYFSPAHYRIFAQVDTNSLHKWVKMADDVYPILASMKSPVGLYANWYEYDYISNAITPGKWYPDPSDDKYGYDAFRTFFRVGLDYEWFKNPYAQLVEKDARAFFENQYNTNGKVFAVYDLSGNVVPGSNYEDRAINTAPLFNLYYSDSKKFTFFVRDFYLDKVNNTTKLFNVNDNYYNLNWTSLSMMHMADMSRDGLSTLILPY